VLPLGPQAFESFDHLVCHLFNICTNERGVFRRLFVLISRLRSLRALVSLLCRRLFFRNGTSELCGKLLGQRVNEQGLAWALSVQNCQEVCQQALDEVERCAEAHPVVL